MSGRRKFADRLDFLSEQIRYPKFNDDAKKRRGNITGGKLTNFLCAFAGRKSSPFLHHQCLPLSRITRYLKRAESDTAQAGSLTPPP